MIFCNLVPGVVFRGAEGSPQVGICFRSISECDCDRVSGKRTGSLFPHYHELVPQSQDEAKTANVVTSSSRYVKIFPLI